MKTKTIVILIILAALAAGIVVLVMKGKGNHISIGTGSTGGVYYPVGGAIAEIINSSDEYDFDVTVETSEGSPENVNLVMDRKRELGIVQADIHYNAYQGKGGWEGKAQEKLRSVCSLHYEMVTIVAADDSGIRSVQDLRGKTVSIGSPNSGNRRNAEAVLAAAGIGLDEIQAESFKPDAYGSMLQDGRIDAAFYTVGHPSGAIEEVTAGLRRKVRFVPITGMEQLMEQSPYYTMADIPLERYPKAVNEEPVKTLAMRTTLVTHADVSDEVIYAVIKAIFGNLEQFRKKHPALATLTAEGMQKGLAAPLHDGAKKYLQEAGLLLEP
jgi:hypothetical protein